MSGSDDYTSHESLAAAIWQTIFYESERTSWEEQSDFIHNAYMCHAAAVIDSGALARHDDLIRADTLMENRHLVIGTPGFQALTDRAAELRGKV